MQTTDSPARTLYDEDFYRWANRTAELIRTGRWDEIDACSLAEEIESLARRDKREVINRLSILITHLLKWQVQVERRSRNWRSTIFEQRSRLLRVLEDSPSLAIQLDEFIATAWPAAVRKAVDQMQLLQNPFPADCSLTREQILEQEIEF